jgi:hypothetical protein
MQGAMYRKKTVNIANALKPQNFVYSNLKNIMFESE